MKTSHTVATLNVLTLKEITEIASDHSITLGVKVTKRFATKPAAIKKALKLQAEINDVLDNPVSIPAKPAIEPDADLVEPLTIETNRKAVKPAPKKAAVKTTLDLEAKVVILSDNPKGTIEKFIHNAIVEGYNIVGSLAGEIIDVHTLARSGNKVDMKYALRNIKLFADRNSIKVGK